MKILLVDNGSLEPAAVIAQREVAGRLAGKVGRPIFPVSLAHSDKIPAAEIGGNECASLGGGRCVGAVGEVVQCVEAFLREELVNGEREFVILPFFIGPSRAVTHALPKLIDTLRGDFPGLRVQIVPVLHAAGDDRLAQILADRVRSALSEIGKPGKTDARGKTEAEMGVRVALVDHGSPTREVTAVRDEVAGQLAALFGDDGCVAEVAACSMERRPGAAYAFNEPLLETLLAREGWRSSTVVVAQLFLLPGRHAGPGGGWRASAGGDISQICARAKEHSPNLRTVQTEPLATHPLLVELLAERLGKVLPRGGLRHAAYVNVGRDY